MLAVTARLDRVSGLHGNGPAWKLMLVLAAVHIMILTERWWAVKL